MPKFKNKRVKNKEKIDSTPLEVKDLYKWLIIVLLVFGFTYLIISLITGEVNLKLPNKENKNDTTKTEIDYKKILAGETFNKDHDDYYVIFYDFKSSDKDNYQAYILNKKTPIYQVDTSDKMNEQYITDGNPNKDASKISELKVKNPTLIKITNKLISIYMEDKDSIINELDILN